MKCEIVTHSIVSSLYQMSMGGIYDGEALWVIPTRRIDGITGDLTKPPTILELIQCKTVSYMSRLLPNFGMIDAIVEDRKSLCREDIPLQELAHSTHTIYPDKPTLGSVLDLGHFYRSLTDDDPRLFESVMDIFRYKIWARLDAQFRHLSTGKRINLEGFNTLLDNLDDEMIVQIFAPQGYVLPIGVPANRVSVVHKSEWSTGVHVVVGKHPVKVNVDYDCSMENDTTVKLSVWGEIESHDSNVMTLY